MVSACLMPDKRHNPCQEHGLSKTHFLQRITPWTAGKPGPEPAGFHVYFTDGVTRCGYREPASIMHLTFIPPLP